MKMNHLKCWGFLLSLVFLSACGGGGDSTPPSTNAAPSLSLSVNAVTLNEDFGTFVINTTATDAEDGTLSVTVSGQAGLLTTDVTTGRITLTSIANANGTATLTVRATDSGNLSATTEVVVAINAINDAPTLVLSTTAISLNEDFGAFVINATATDVDDGALLVTVTGQAGLLTTNITTDQITLTSIANANGTATLTVSANDSGNLSVSTEVLVVINAINDTPTLTFSTTQFSLNANFTSQTIATATDVEDASLLLTFALSATDVVQITTVANRFILNSITDAFGETTITLTATDNSGNQSSQIFTVRVNGFPTLALSTQNITLDEDFGTFIINTTATDAEDGVLPVAVTGQDASLFAITTSANQIMLASIANANGTATLTVSIVDSGNLSASTEVVVIVNAVNDTPTLTFSTTQFSLNANFTSQTIATAADVDDTSLLLTFALSATDVVQITTVANQFILNPIINAFGDATITLVVSDAGVRSSSQVFTVRVNTPTASTTPTLALSTQNITLDEDFGTFIINTTASDAEDGALLVTVSGQAGLLTTNVTTDQITLTSVSNANGIVTLNVLAIDSGDLAVSTEVVVTINAVNDSPTLTLSTTNLSLSEDFGTFVINTTASDAEDGALLVTVSGQAGLLTTNATTDQITLTSVANANGITTLTVSATDSDAITVSTEVVVVINAVNDTPTLSLSVTQRTLAQNFGTFVINATATDVESGTLGFSVSTGNGIVDVTTSVNTITLQSLANVIGDVTLTVSVSDGLLTATQSIFISVSSGPTFELSTNTIVLDEDFTTFTINTTATAADGAILPTSVLQSTPNLLTFSTTTGRITLSSIANVNGVTTLTVSATNQGGITNTTEVAITINSINDTPTLSLSSTNLTLAPNSTGLITAFGADLETSSASLVYSVQQNPSLLQLSTQGNVIVLRSTTTAGSTTLVITVTDGGNLSASATARVTVLSGVLNIALNVKRINFSWNTSPTANHYRMLSNVDLNAGGGFVDASSASLVFIPNSTNIINTTVSATVDVAGYLSTANGPQYLLQACSSVDNSVCSDHAQQSLSNAQLEGLIGYFKASNTDANDRFGRDVAISGDGNTLVVSAQFEDSTATGINGDQTNNGAGDSGAVYVFVRNSAGTWSQQAYIKASNAEANDQFGTAISISDNGNTLIVGAFGEDSTATGVNGDQTNNGAGDSGAAYVFVRSSTAGTWSQQAYLKASNTEAGDEFSREGVSISGDGNTLIVSALGEDSSATGVGGDETSGGAADSGAAYVFVRSSTDSSWSQQAYIKASNPNSTDRFGEVVSLDDDGNTLVIGAPFEDSTATGINGNETSNGALGAGAAYVFVRSTTGTWSQQAYIKASNTDSLDNFGLTVPISDDGNTIVIGAAFEDSDATGINGDEVNNNSTNTGAAYVFVRSTTGTWSQQAYIKASNAEDGDLFGLAAGISGDGNTLIVGARDEDSNATGINGDETVNNATNAGAAYLFVRSSTGTWSQQAYIKASNTEANDLFSSALSISDDGRTLAIGSNAEESDATGINGDQADNSQDNAGAVYLY